MAPAEEGAREAALLRRRLSGLIRDSGVSAAEVGRRLGRPPESVRRALAGRAPLRVREVFGMLAALGQPPGAFFERHYPLGGWRAEAPLAALLELAGSAGPGAAPEELAARTGALLRARIAGTGRDARLVSRALGFSREGLGRLLDRPSGLDARTLFGALAAIGVTPARFFAELFSPYAAEASPGLSQAELLEAVEHLLEAVGAEAEEAG